MNLNIEKKTLANKNYRKVIDTTDQMQLVLMCLKKGEDIPSEIHKDTTQFFRIEKGEAMIKVGRKVFYVSDGDAVIVPAGKRHYVKNTSSKDLKMYTIYTPPEHPPHRVNKRQPK